MAYHYQEFQVGEKVGIYEIMEFLGDNRYKYIVKCSLCGESSIVRSDKLRVNRYCVNCSGKNRLKEYKYSSGQIVGNDTIIRYAPEAGKSHYLAKCNTCNTERILQTWFIGKANGCYNCVARIAYKPGDVVGIFTIINWAGHRDHQRTQSSIYQVKCNLCDNEQELQVGYLHTYANGCTICAPSAIKLVDGVSSTNHYLFSVRDGMLARCYRPNNISYEHYGAKGVTVCDRWRFGEFPKTGFQCFVEDIHSELGLRPNMASILRGDYKEGFDPQSYHLGRINHEKPYGPGNVRWETSQESNQEMNNRHKLLKQQAELERSGPWLTLPAEEMNGHLSAQERISAWES